MILQSVFQNRLNATGALNVHVSYYCGDDDGCIAIPSLGYDRYNSERHFYCDEAGFVFGETIFRDNEENVFLNFTLDVNDNPAYDTYDDLPSALNDMIVSEYPNAHAVQAIAERDAKGVVTHVCLLIYWK